MSELIHRIKLFVYRIHEERPDYLLLKPDQGIEGFWGPLQSSLGFGEKLDQAIQRKIVEVTGAPNPGQVIDLEMNQLWILGDEEVVEWAFGCNSLVAPMDDRLQAISAAHRWAEFTEAYSALELEHDRAAIMRLHTFLGAA